MGAAIGWMQSRSEEGRVSWPGRRGNWSCSSEGRVLCPRKWMAAALRWRSGFPRIAGPLVLCSRCWVHDSFQMLPGLSDAPTLLARCRCQAATEHRINFVHLVLLSIWKDELGSETVTQKRTQKQSTIGEDARTDLVTSL